MASLKDKPVRVLEIGSFEGRSAVWLCENILTHPDARITCVDTFEGEDGHTPEKENLRSRFEHNIEPFRSKVDIIQSMSADALRKMTGEFDFIYIDGCHYTANVLEDAVLAFPLLKVGGIMIFDDYMNGDIHSIKYPHIGVNAFVQCYQERLILLAQYEQLVLKKASD